MFRCASWWRPPLEPLFARPARAPRARKRLIFPRRATLPDRHARWSEGAIAPRRIHALRLGHADSIKASPAATGARPGLYGGKVDGFLKIDAEKLGLWSGLHVNVQYEHYFGENINRKDFALIPVNTAQAYLGEGTFHSALSISVTQDLSEQVSVSAGKFNMMTLASRTPLIGGGGIDTFMNRALALPSTGVAYTAARGGAADRVVISAPYLIGGLMTIKTAPVIVTFGLLDPRSAENLKCYRASLRKRRRGGRFGDLPDGDFRSNWLLHLPRRL